MAGIEKVCEFSDEYYSYDMYGYKRNHIQIHPKYRERFAGASHTLHINEVIPSESYKRIACYSDFGMHSLGDYEPPFHDVREYKDYVAYFEGKNVVPRVEFTLEVHDPELVGEVNGRYSNSTLDFQTTKRRLKRMLKCRDLNVVSHLEGGQSVGEFWRAFLKQRYVPED